MIRIVEVGPRDGLQNEPLFLPTEKKINFVNALSKTGASEIEVSSFVSPKWVPQLKDAAKVFEGITRNEGIVYSALVPNLKGLERALEVNVDKVAIFTAASETFSMKNSNASIAGSLLRSRPVIEQARKEGLLVRAYVSTSFWCPYENKIEPETVLKVVRELADWGIEDISIGDTLGKASVEEVETLLEALLKEIPASHLAMHFHDTFGRACDNVEKSWRMGIESFDACTGGIGGCPYAPGASGNVSTAEVVKRLLACGAQVESDLEAIERAQTQIMEYLGGSVRCARKL